jgi:hypothetical protein
MVLNKERASKIANENKVEELKSQIAGLEREIQLLASPAARAAARDSKESKGESNPPKDVKKELAAANKQVF